MAKEKKKWFWPTVRIGLPIGIVTAGAVFVVLAVIFKLIDAESARYLLSAIVQSLAALLAIIFAGVAILWGQETQVITRLETIRDNYDENESLNSLIEPIRKMMIRVLGNSEEIKQVTKIEQERRESALLTLNKVSAWRYTIDHDLNFRATLNAANQDVLDHYRNNYRWKKIIGMNAYRDLLNKAEAFFKCMRAISHYVDKYGDEDIAQRFIPFRDRMAKHGIEHLLKVLRRGERARKEFLRLLLPWYSITIAGGMVFLSVLKQGVCDLQATWIAAFPLGFGIGAVALTFIYLARIVSGEKNG